MIAQAEAKKPTAPEGVEQSVLDSVVEATERMPKDEAILHVYKNLEAYKGVASSIARSGLTHHKTDAHVITIAIAAYEMNLGVMVALRGMYLVGGKLAMETWLMDLLATRLGVTKTVHESSLLRCRLTLHHDERPDIPTEYTLEDAKRAGIIKDFDPKTGVVTTFPRSDTWRKHTEEMLYWRALSKGLRRIAPDLFGGVYTTDEADGFDPRKKEGAEPTATNAELDALTNGVEPDSAEMSLDEIDQFTGLVERAVSEKLVTPADAKTWKNHAIEGRWTEAREAWDETMSRIAHAEADRQQGREIKEAVEGELFGADK